jgi:hypothetical protein
MVYASSRALAKLGAQILRTGINKSKVNENQKANVQQIAVTRNVCLVAYSKPICKSFCHLR